jgi:hypothetical protein
MVIGPLEGVCLDWLRGSLEEVMRAEKILRHNADILDEP